MSSPKQAAARLATTLPWQRNTMLQANPFNCFPDRLVLSAQCIEVAARLKETSWHQQCLRTYTWIPAPSQ
jgi:hypothetical protein